MKENAELYTYVVMLLPINKQATRMKITLIACILAYNWVCAYFNEKIKLYHELTKSAKELYLSLDEKVKANCPWYIGSDSYIRKLFTKYKEVHDEDCIKNRAGLTNKEACLKHLDILFYEVSNDALKQSVRDALKAWRDYFKGVHARPRYKSFDLTNKSFYVDSLKIKFEDFEPKENNDKNNSKRFSCFKKGSRVKLEKLGKTKSARDQQFNMVKMAEPHRIPRGVKYYNCRVKYDGERFWLSVSVDKEYRPDKRKEEIIVAGDDTIVGYDLNVKTINGSDGSVYNTARNDSRYKEIDKKKKRLQRICARKYKALEDKALLVGDTYTYKDKSGKKITRGKVRKKSKKLIKAYKKSAKVCHALANLKKQIDMENIMRILNPAPKVIVLEDLDIKSMQKNHNVSRGIQIVGLRSFIMALLNKIRFTNIIVIIANKYFPSSKKCNNCGYIYKDLKLSDRVWICPCCGKTINRDYNAALNLRDYGIKELDYKFKK